MTVTGCVATVAGPPAPLPLVDRAVTESALEVPAIGVDRVAAITVGVEVEHPYPRDLQLTLIAPAGESIALPRGQLTFGDELGRLVGARASGRWVLRVADLAAGDSGVLRRFTLRVDACERVACATRTVALAHEAAGFESLPLAALFVVEDAARVVTARAGFTVENAFTEDLGLRLWSPSGTAIDLSSGNGGLGSDYQGTVFDDAAPASILDGFAPFAGRFRPEQPLSGLAGEVAAGPWILEVGRVEGPWFDEQGASRPRFARASLELDVCD